MTQRIIGTFQAEAENDNGRIIEIGSTAFDATLTILAMDIEAINELNDCDDSSGFIGRQHVEHDGPFSVFILDGIEKFFGVSDVELITQEMLDAKRDLFSDELLRERLRRFEFTIRLDAREYDFEVLQDEVDAAIQSIVERHGAVEYSDCRLTGAVYHDGVPGASPGGAG